MSSVNDYAGRKVDLLAYQGAKEYGEAKLSSELFNSDGQGMICAGVQSLCQRFLIELLTQRGSMTYQPDRGTYFIGKLRLGYLRTEQEVRTAFSEALSDIYANLKATEDDSDPDDEKYDSAELLSIALSPDVVSLKIRILSAAGTSRTVLMPIAAMPNRT